MTTTEIQQFHRDEQMEAARREFASLWAIKLKPILFTGKVHMHTDDADFAFIELACWTAFRSGLEQKNPVK